jgi:hypothetical protein
MIEVLTRSVDLLQAPVARSEAETDVLIEPRRQRAEPGLRSFSRGRRYIKGPAKRPSPPRIWSARCRATLRPSN